MPLYGRHVSSGSPVSAAKAQLQLFYEDAGISLEALLRERGKDILEIAETLLKQRCEALARPLLKFSPKAIQAITTYVWPGNIRELENLIEQGVALAIEGVIQLDDIIPPEMRSSEKKSEKSPRSLQDVVDRAEREAMASLRSELRRRGLLDGSNGTLFDNAPAMYRFACARGYDVARAVEMFEAHAKWRRDWEAEEAARSYVLGGADEP